MAREINQPKYPLTHHLFNKFSEPPAIYLFSYLCTFVHVVQQ